MTLDRVRRFWRGLDRQTGRKVPELTVLFWVIKLLSTAMGESSSDYLVFHIDPYVAVVVASLGLLAALAISSERRATSPRSIGSPS